MATEEAPDGSPRLEQPPRIGGELDSVEDDVLERALDSIGARIDATQTARSRDAPLRLERLNVDAPAGPSSRPASRPPSPARPSSSSAGKRKRETANDESIHESGTTAPPELPDDILQHVFAFLDGPEVVCAARVCKKWADIASRSALWRAVYLRRWQRVGYYQIGIRGRGIASAPGLLWGDSLSGHWSGAPNLAKCKLPEPAKIDDVDDAAWRGLYVERDELERNWKRGRYRVDFLDGHAGAVCSLQCVESFVVTGGQDREVKLWDADSGRCTATLRGHTGAVWSVYADGDSTVVSGSGDSTIKVWDLMALECVDTLKGHTAEVWAIQVDAERVASASVDSTMRLWDRATSACVRTLHGHLSSVFSIQLRGETLLSGGSDGTARLWDLRAGEHGGLVRTMRGHTQQVFTVQYNDSCARQAAGDRRSLSDCFAGPAARYDRALTGSGDATMKLWELGCGRCVRTFEGHRDSVWCARYDGRRIVSGGVDRSVRVWSDEEGRPLGSHHVHVEPIFCLDIDEAKIVSGSGDGVIGLWDFSRRTKEELDFDRSSWKSDGASVEAHRQFFEQQEDQQATFERARHSLCASRRLATDRLHPPAKFG